MFTFIAKHFRARRAAPSFEGTVLRELRRLNANALVLQRKIDDAMIDTSKLLAAVAKQTTDVASLRALADAQNQAMATLSQQLAAAIAANDPAAIAQVQADLDKAVADLSTSDDGVVASLAANVQPSAGPQT